MKRHWPLAVILALFAAAVGLEIGWGLPGRRRVELLLPDGLTDETVAEIAARSRDRLAAGNDRPIPTLGAAPPSPVYDRGEALDTCRRFLLYSDNPDEMLALMALARMRPAEGRFDPGMGQYGGAFLYPLGAWLKAASLTPWVTGGDLEFYLRRPEEFGRMYVAGRLLVALCVLGSLVAVYRVGCRLGGRTAGAAAAGLLAFSPAVLTWAVVLKPHAAAMLPAAALAVGWALAYYESPRRRTLVLAALAAGLAAGMTLVAAPLGLTVLGAAWLEKRSGAGSRALRILLAAGVAAGVFLAVNPYHVISLGDRLAEWRHVAGFHGGLNPWGPVAFLAGPMREAFGAVFLAAALAAIVIFLIQQTRRAAVLFAPLAAALLVMPLGLGEWAGVPQTARFALPVLPLLTLAVGWGLDHAGAAGRRAVPAVIALMLAMGLPTVYVHWMSAAGTNPRYDAGRWLETCRDMPLRVQFPAAPYRNPTTDYLRREVLYAAAPSREHIRALDSWRPPGELAAPGWQIFALDARPGWLRAPMSFADRVIVLAYQGPVGDKKSAAPPGSRAPPD